jgi:hypothetical protein
MTAALALAPAPSGTRAVLSEVDSALDGLDAGDVVGASEATAVLDQVDRLIRRLQAVRLAVVAEADRGRVADAAGATGTSAWLAQHSRADGAVATRDVKLATALDQGLAATRAAMAQGQLSAEHVAVIVEATAKLPKDLTTTEREQVEHHLVEVARSQDPRTLRKTARRALAATGRPAAEADAHEDTVLRSQEEQALAKSRFSWHDNGDGTTSGSFVLPTLAAAVLIKAVQQIASPRRATEAAARRAGAAVGASGTGADDAAMAASGEDVLESSRWERKRNATWAELLEEGVDWKNRYGQALGEVLEHLPTDHLHGKVAATVVVRMDLDQLTRDLGAVQLDTGDAITASEARRLACQAGIVPAVLSGASLPLDVGRQQRFFTEAQRLALATVYDSCAAQGCDRPFAWTEQHHEDPWASQGLTDVDKAVPLCGPHHRRVHDPRYHHVVGRDQAGKKSVTFELLAGRGPR